jgi:hypothetical protein
LIALAVDIFWVYSLKRNITLHHLAVKGAYAILAQGVFWYILNTRHIDQITIINYSMPELVRNIKYFLQASAFYITALLMFLLLYTNHLQKIFSIIISITILLVTPTAIFYFDQRTSSELWDSGNAEPYIILRKVIPESATVYCAQGVKICWFMLRRQQYIYITKTVCWYCFFQRNDT